MEVLQHAGIFALLTLAIQLIPLIMATVYVVRPSERRLALMRPLSLAALFAALAGAVVGFLHVLRGMGLTSEFSANSFHLMALGASESLVPMFVGFASLTVAWLLVAVGMSRDRLEP